MIRRVSESFDELKRQLSEQKTDVKKDILERNCTLDEKVGLIDTIEFNINQLVNGSDILTCLELLRSIKENAPQDLTVLNTFWSPLYE